MLDCFPAASCKCNDSNLCKSCCIRGQLVRNHCFLVFFLLFDDFFSAAKCFDLLLTHVKIVFLGKTYFSATSLFDRPFSRSLKVWHFSPKLFTLSFRLTEDMLLPWKKERPNFRTKVWQCKYQHSNAWNEQYDSFENLSRMFERADGKQP